MDIYVVPNDFYKDAIDPLEGVETPGFMRNHPFAGGVIHSEGVERSFPSSGTRETISAAKDETTPGHNPAAPTAGDPGSSRTRRSERRERPMPIVPATPDVALPAPLGLLMAAAMSNADGCPECPNTEPPRAAVPTRLGWMCSYLCADCGAAWTTDYREDV